MSLVMIYEDIQTEMNLRARFVTLLMFFSARGWAWQTAGLSWLLSRTTGALWCNQILSGHSQFSSNAPWLIKKWITNSEHRDTRMISFNLTFGLGECKLCPKGIMQATFMLYCTSRLNLHAALFNGKTDDGNLPISNSHTSCPCDLKSLQENHVSITVWEHFHVNYKKCLCNRFVFFHMKMFHVWF